MKSYHSEHLVKGEDLNHHGTLFAARSAAWFVESAFVAAACEHGDPAEVMCRNIHGMAFTMPVPKGDIIDFSARIARVGKTSMTVCVNVTSELTGLRAVQGFITFVTVDRETGKKREHGVRLDEPMDEAEREERAKAEALFA